MQFFNLSGSLETYKMEKIIYIETKI